jgi:hypothetical protein
VAEVAIVFAWVALFGLICVLIAIARGFEWWIGALMGLLGCVGVVLMLVMKPKANSTWLGHGALPPPPVGAQWVADPTRRHELRLWDGATWTGHISDRGVSGWDPLQ